MIKQVSRQKGYYYGHDLWIVDQMVRWVCWSPLSSTDPNNIGQRWKITCYV